MNLFIPTLRWILVGCMAGILLNDAQGTPKNTNKTETSLAPMACNDLLHVSLDTLCSATLTPAMLLEVMIGSPSDYSIKVYNANGTEQPDISFDYTDIKKTYNYRIWYLPNGNSCAGKVYIEDKYPPQIQCHVYSIRCGLSISPWVLGFPIPQVYSVTIDSTAPNTFSVKGWDACSAVTLSYRDAFFDNQCDSLCFKRIVRSWFAIDAVGNSSECSDTICILRPTEDDIVYPHHYDNFDLPHISCDYNFPKLPNGNPSPDYTGWPIPNGCSTLAATYTDLRINTCGNTFKVIRHWVILNWCTKNIIEFNQIIKVADDTPPIFDCPGDFTVGMALYSCQSDGKIPKLDSVIDCNSWTYEVFSMTEDPITGIPNQMSSDYIVFDPYQNCYFLRGAPEGRIWIVYRVTDACGNVSECQVESGVIDNLAPIPICDQKTVVTLGIDGIARAYASVFDDHSLDNCGIDHFSVRRMDDNCSTGTNVFGPYVDFCCADVGNIVMVALEVSDFYGNKNTCMVEVTVQDKVPPVIVAPTDITVSCSFPIDYNDMSKFGSIRLSQADRKRIFIADPYYSNTNFNAGVDGLVTDNCDVRFTESIVKDIHCNSGTIQRIFVATDNQGLTDTAIQTITVINLNPFTIYDIFWPPYIEINSCNNVSTHPDQTGYPIYFNTNCAQVVANYTDTKLSVLDSTCYKILRKWVVLDWCQYDRVTNNGYWEYTQIISIRNSEPPVITSCNDLDICDQNSFKDPKTGKCMGSYLINGDGFDDCTDAANLVWSYRLDENNDGSFGPIINGNLAIGILPVGTHRLRWILTDQCGNISTCDQIFTLRDCKKPTPYCLNGIVTVVMPTTGTVTVWAKDLNLASFDNCTDAKDLRFSFSPDTKNASITYNCDSLNRQKSIIKVVRVYVTDEYGNQDFCETTIRIQDNNNVCPGTSPGLNLSGKVQRDNKDVLPGTQINLRDSSSAKLDAQIVDNQGAYAFQNISIPDYYLNAEKQDEITNGVSTLDIVFIQRHILGLKPFDSPYKILAADVNGSNSITAKDVSDIRKVILGLATQFPNQTPVWKFVDGDFKFANPNMPWDVPTIIKSGQIADNYNQANFVGIKMGDVDLSAKIQLGNSNISRNNGNINWIIGKAIVNSENEIEIAVQSAVNADIDGFQLEVILNSNKVSVQEIKAGILDIQPDEYFAERNQLAISSAYSHAVSCKAGDVLFKIILNGKISLNDADHLIKSAAAFSNEIYINDEAHSLILRDQQGTTGAGFIAYPVQPNPFTEEAIIRYELPDNANVNLQVYDLNGKRIFTTDRNGIKGRNEISISRKEFKTEGLLYYILTTPFGSVTEKMLVIE